MYNFWAFKKQGEAKNKKAVMQKIRFIKLVTGFVIKE